MGKTFKDRARYDRKNDRYREERATPPRFNDRSYREQSQTAPRQVPQSTSTANTAA